MHVMDKKCSITKFINAKKQVRRTPLCFSAVFQECTIFEFLRRHDFFEPHEAKQYSFTVEGKKLKVLEQNIPFGHGKLLLQIKSFLGQATDFDSFLKT